MTLETAFRVSESAVQVDLSVIIVNWNSKEHLVRCLQSLREQECSLIYEVIVVDNGSTDGSDRILEEESEWVRTYLSKDNLGFATASNAGIRRSCGEYVCLVNPDVVLSPNTLQKLYRYMADHPAVGIAGPRVLSPDGTLQVTCRVFPSLRTTLCRALALDRLFPRSRFLSSSFMDYSDHDREEAVDVLTGCFWIVRREAIDAVGLLDEKFFLYSEDVDWCKRFCEAGWLVSFYPDVEVEHVGGGSSTKQPLRSFMEMQKAQALYWRKHHGSIQFSVWRCLSVVHHLFRMIASGLSYVFLSRRREEELYTTQRSLLALSFFLFGCSNPDSDKGR